MIVPRFADTNILLYAISSAPDESEKAKIAAALLKAPDLALSVQVFQEFYVQATRPSARDPLAPEEALNFLATLRRFPVLDLSLELFVAAAATSRRWRISYWDAAVVEAARVLGCPEVLSEDLQDGMDFGGVKVTNPFRRPEQVL